MHSKRGDDDMTESLNDPAKQQTKRGCIERLKGSLKGRLKGRLKAGLKVRRHLSLLCLLLSIGSGQHCLAQDSFEPLSEVDRLLGPLKLVTPLSHESVLVILNEAESQYRRGNVAQAMAGFQTLIGLEALLSRAWLRMGNLYQTAGLEVLALSAYGRAAAVQAPSAEEVLAKQKALFNIGVVHLDKAQQALRRLEQFPRSQLESNDRSRTAGQEVLLRQESLRDEISQVQERLEVQQPRFETPVKQAQAR